MAIQTGYPISSSGAQGWTDSSNAYTEDGLYAIATSTTRSAYAFLVLNISGFAIPTNATINSVTVYFKRKWSSGASSYITLSNVRARKSTTTRGEFIESTFPTTDTVSSFDAGTWTISELNGNNLSVEVDIQRGSNNKSTTCSLDVAYVVVDYTENGPSTNVNLTTVVASSSVSILTPNLLCSSIITATLPVTIAIALFPTLQSNNILGVSRLVATTTMYNPRYLSSIVLKLDKLMNLYLYEIAEDFTINLDKYGTFTVTEVIEGDKFSLNSLGVLTVPSIKEE